MAHTTQDTVLLPVSSGKEVREKVLEIEGAAVEVVEMKDVEDGSSSTPSVAVADPHVEKTISQNSSDTQGHAPPPRPSLVPLGSSNPQGSGLTPTAPHPKKFNTVNITKKFLERNSSASTSTTSSSNSSAAKSGSPVARPAAQPASSHSRLVTTKLTANPAVSSAAAGWSRPSSVTPSPATATNSPSSTSPLPSTTPIQTSTTAAPQLPHVGKVIQPQPRTAVPQPNTQQKDSGSSKPVWRNVRPPNVPPIRSDAQTSDFPTAAEVANGSSTARKPSKADDAKAILDTAARQLRAEEADAFRGLHLGPNIHHWDEMEGDDDDFLGGVIEFGDGRQYKIESNDLPQETSSSLLSHSMAEGDLGDSSLSITKEDRFVDDFDRSWPRSRNSPAEVARDFPPAASPNISPDISHPAQALQDSSRVLFNERSNRLEPYSQSHRTGQGPFNGKRAAYQEASGSEPRGMRDGPHNVQVLQKTIGGEFGSRSRRFSGGSAGFGSGPSNGFTDRHRDRDYPNRRDGLPPSPRLSRDHHQAQTDSSGRDWDLGSDRGRRTTMGPPPIPAHAQKYSQEEGRQLPPHLNQAPANVHPRRISSRDSRLAASEPPLSAALPPNLTRLPPQSPSVSHASLVLVSPISGQNIALPLNAPELDEARKDVMQSAAARAKQRRQQEEEEREAQKERARKKAVELEEKMKAAETDKAKQKEAEAAAAKEKEVVAVIDDAVTAVNIKALEGGQSDPARPPRRPPSLKAVPRQPVIEPFRSAGPRRPSMLSPRSAPLSASIPPVSATSPASQIDSWRVKSNPPPPQVHSRPSATPTFIAPPPSALDQVESIADGAQDDLEVVDFSDMGKFVGAAEAVEDISDPSPAVKINVGVLSRPPRPVASDFFDEPSLSGNTSNKSEFGVWRKVPQDSIAPLDLKTDVAEPSDVSSQTILLQDNDKGNEDQSIFSDRSFFTDLTSTTSMTKEPLSHLDHEHGGQTINVPLNINSHRTPRSQPFYKEAAMSALDDAMSRIKGALVGMQVNEVPKDLSQTGPLDQESRAASTTAPSQAPPKERWVPPALRPRNFEHGDEPQEVFLVTVIEPPRLVPPTGSSLVVRFPSVPRLPMEGISKRQLHLFSKPSYQFRMDNLSFDPPIHDMSRRDLSVNSILFRIPQTGFKGKLRYRVTLPRSRGPKDHIPASNLGRPSGVGAFGRPTISDGATTWRKSASSPTKVEETTSLATGLSTMSRSPPPQSSPAEAGLTLTPKLNEDLSTKADGNHIPVRARSQPKMPIGSAVAFYRDSRIDVVEAVPKSLVNFIVGSELEDSEQISEELIQGGMDAPAFAASSNDVEVNSRSSQPTVNGVTSSPSTSLEQSLPSLVSKTESKSSDDSTDPILITPPHPHAVSWARSSVSLPIKDSPARAPDPEHLKAVWSQTSNKAGLHPVNSLEGIADDLTALPFTLQDVKSEDGETPPPSLPTAPSRMSLHEVTRAFQQVPTSTSTSTPPSHRTAISPPLTNAPVARPTYSYSPLPQNNMRPAYASYPSPMMNHSPAPAMYPHPMAPSPVPGRMPANGHTPLYSQPMWVTVTGPTPQGHGTMMRTVASPYPGPMMYPSPGYVPQPPLSTIIPTAPHTQNGSRGRGGPVMSPGISHAHAHSPVMYGGSPVLLHAMQVPQNHGFMPMPTGRGQPRTENGPSQQQHHNNHHPPSHTGFNPGANTSFVRPAW
ncbi:hypothetical protein BYT27DRAFT_6560143 [Phlegmacium glaucopus]|nr:hypothetical protein BYT27DRAFT_6560143 [Phlegmacium glaucopus]